MESEPVFGPFRLFLFFGGGGGGGGESGLFDLNAKEGRKAQNSF